MSARPAFPRAASALAAAALAAHAVAGAPEGPAPLKGRPVVLEEPPPTQLKEIARPRPLGDALKLGDASFPTSKSGATTFIATLPGGTPTTAVKAGETLHFAWKEAGAGKQVRVGFAALPDGGFGAFDAAAWRYVVAGTTVTLVDGNLDGVFGDPAKDGVVVGDPGFVLPLGAPLVIGRSRVKLESIAPDGSSLVARVEPVVGAEQQLATLEALNRVRLCVGVPPADLDDEKSRGCTAHGRYLAANHWTGSTNPHDESPGAPGYSEDGRRAAQQSVITTDPPAMAVASFWQTWYHRAGLVTPWLAKVGVAAEPPTVSIVDVSAWKDVPESSPWSDPVFAPADGSAGVPTSFWRTGERPNAPVSDAGRRGMPLMVLFASRDHGATGLAVKLVELRGAKETPVKALIADPRDLVQALGCVPEAPLAAKTAYQATFTFTREEKVETHVVRFKTE